MRHAGGGGADSLDGNMIVPIDLLPPILDDMQTLGRTQRPPKPWLGAYVTEVDEALVVAGLAPEGPAEQAELQVGDQVLAVNSQPVSSLVELFRSVWAVGKAGVAVPLTVMRDGEHPRGAGAERHPRRVPQDSATSLIARGVSRAAPRRPLSGPKRARTSRVAGLVTPRVRAPRGRHQAIECCDLRKTTAQHDHVGVDKVDDGGKSLGQALGIAGHGFHRRPVPRVRPCSDGFGRGLAAAERGVVARERRPVEPGLDAALGEAPAGAGARRRPPVWATGL